MKKLLLFIFVFITSHVYAQEKYSLFEKGDDGASCIIYGVKNIKQQEIRLPQGIDKALQCPVIASIKDSLLIYDDTASVNMYDLVTGKIIMLFALPKHCDGAAGPCWSPSGRKLMFVVINQSRDEGFEKDCRIMVVTPDKKGDAPYTEYFDRAMNYECGSFCNAEPGVDFVFETDAVIKYRQMKEDAEGPNVYDRISLNK